jgi:hypothetical protein
MLGWLMLRSVGAVTVISAVELDVPVASAWLTVTVYRPGLA